MAVAPWDAGLQPERTTLAWVRTGLALAVLSLLLSRLTASSGGVVALSAGLVGLIVAAAVVHEQSSRYQRYDARLREGAFRPALLAAFVATAWTVTLAGAALVAIVAGAD